MVSKGKINKDNDILDMLKSLCSFCWFSLKIITWVLMYFILLVGAISAIILFAKLLPATSKSLINYFLGVIAVLLKVFTLLITGLVICFILWLVGHSIKEISRKSKIDMEKRKKKFFEELKRELKKDESRKPIRR